MIPWYSGKVCSLIILNLTNIDQLRATYENIFFFAYVLIGLSSITNNNIVIGIYDKI